MVKEVDRVRGRVAILEVDKFEVRVLCIVRLKKRYTRGFQ